MTQRERLKQITAMSPNGIITSKQVAMEGLHRGTLGELVKEGELYRCGRGVYAAADAWEDELFLLQSKYKRGIFSHDTALFLHGYSERTPAVFTMTFPKGYNSPSLKNENVIVKRAVQQNYYLGITELKTPCGNTVLAYELERTLCDILRGSGSDTQLVLSAMKRYAASKEKDIDKLLRCAEKLHVSQKVLRYMEVLL